MYTAEQKNKTPSDIKTVTDKLALRAWEKDVKQFPGQDETPTASEISMTEEGRNVAQRQQKGTRGRASPCV